ncbi:MAG: phosphopantothenoylcysteine decarboxylase [Verrucomicrobiales bacterium]
MKVIVTCGPSFEPVDEVRRITNFSTGELGALLSAAFADAGFETICLRGLAATHPAAPAGAELRKFTTNDDLARQLRTLGELSDVAGVFHAAALCDYRVQRVADATGREVGGAKIASRGGALTIQLETATKLISHLRDWFPGSLIVGWKFELDGTPADAIGKARRQVMENRTDACVVNGRAYGDGFGFVLSPGFLGHLPDRQSLCAFLVSWLQMPAARREHVSAAIAGSPFLQTAA